jgi:DNA mismatch endonuclease, patch repair protein
VTGQGEDEFVATDAGAHLRGRATYNTAPEVSLRRALHARGVRFRLNTTLGHSACRPDLTLPRSMIAIFVDGCFWHSCPQHGAKSFTGPNAERWSRKMQRNRDRDRKQTAELAEAGWLVIRVWECEIKTKLASVVESVLSAKRARDLQFPSTRRSSTTPVMGTNRSR